MYYFPTNHWVKEYLICNGRDVGLEMKSCLEAQLILLLKSWRKAEVLTPDVSYLASKPRSMIPGSPCPSLSNITILELCCLDST